MNTDLRRRPVTGSRGHGSNARSAGREPGRGTDAGSARRGGHAGSSRTSGREAGPSARRGSAPSRTSRNGTAPTRTASPRRPGVAPTSRRGHVDTHLRAKRAPARSQKSFVLTFRAGNPRRRMLVVFVVSVLLFTAVVARVAFLQTVGSDALVDAGRAQRVSESVLHAQRGTIFARDGGELAISVPSSTLFANPKLVTDPTGTASALASMLALTPEKEQALLAAFTAKDKSFVYVARQIDDETANTVMALNLPGIDMLREDKRIMPSGEVGRSVLGRTDIDGKGTAGLELQYQDLLAGKDGERVREHDKNGRSIPGSGATTVEPVPGDDLILTIDRSLQFQVEQALTARVEQVRGQGGTVVVMDTATGEIYAIANVERGDDLKVHVTSANLAAVEAFEPGSVAKVFSLAAVVDSGAAAPDTVITVPGKLVFNEESKKWKQTIYDAEPHGDQDMSLRNIIVHSSNIGTYLMSQRIGSEKLASYLDKFGFGHKTSLDFPGESRGSVDPPSKWFGSENATITYGYGYQATALQFTAAANAVANGGVYVEPKLLKATIGADGKVVDTDPSATHEVITSASAATMTSMMKDVVCFGTGKDAQIPGVSVAGKTGTAYKVQADGTYGTDQNRKYRASFVGFFPADHPKLTIFVTIDEPDPTSKDRFGGKASAPLFATIAQAAIHELGITPTPGDAGCPQG